MRWIKFKSWQIDCFMLVVFLLAAGLFSMTEKYELIGDLMNYHYYNAFAFLNDRLGYDIAPAMTNTYQNPLIELPYYSAVQLFNDNPDLVYFLQGLWFGALVFVFWKILKIFFVGKIEILAVLAIGVTGFATFFQIGTTTNEIQIALLIMIAFYILLKELFVNQQSRKAVLFVCGLILGCALGFKLTAVTYCVASGLSLILFYKKLDKPWLKIALFVLGGLIGFLLINGWHMWDLWVKFQNPVFPLLNSIFKSEYFYDMNFSDKRFLPKSWMQYIFYPFYWAIHRERVTVSEIPFIDFRFAIAEIILLVSLLFYRKIKLDDKTKFLFCFMLISYLFWLSFFGIIRYLVVVEMLLAIVFVKAFMTMLPKNVYLKTVVGSVGFVMFFVLVTVKQYSEDWGSMTTARKAVEFEEFEIKDNTLVLLFGEMTSITIPGFAEKAKVRAIGMYHHIDDLPGNDFAEREKFKAKRDEVIKNHKGDMIAVISSRLSNDIDAYKKVADVLGTVSCQSFKNNMDFYIKICLPK